MSANASSSFNTKSTHVASTPVAINPILNLVNSNAHKEVVLRLLLEAMNRPHREMEELMHAHTRINMTSLDDIEEESDTELFEEPSYKDDTSAQSLLQTCRISRIPSPVLSSHCLNGWCVCCHEDDFNQPSYPVPSNHGYDCWRRKCCREDEEDEIYDYTSIQQEEDDEGEPDFAKDDRGGINYHCNRHDKREYRAKSAKKDAEKHSSFKKHFKKRGARNPRTDLRRETRNSKSCIKRKRLNASSDEDENSFENEMLDEPEIDATPVRYKPFEYCTYDNPPLEPQEHFDADLPEKDDRYHRKNRHTKREKHIRDQEKMARELGIPVARKMKRRDIPTSRYNRHKASIDMEEF